MAKKLKIFLFILAAPIFLFSFNVRPVLAADNSAVIAQLEQEIQSLIRQIIALLQQSLQAKTNGTVSQAQLQPVGMQAQIQSPQTQSQTQTGSGSGTLTVNASGATAYVSINGGAQFVYTSPISLNNGDTYSVTASISGGNGSGNSTSKCSGTASSGGTYTCNIKLNSQ